MTHLTFETPSRRCPLRCKNSEPVKLLDYIGPIYLRRQGQHVRAYLVEFDDGTAGFAFADELFVNPR